MKNELKPVAFLSNDKVYINGTYALDNIDSKDKFVPLYAAIPEGYELTKVADSKQWGCGKYPPIGEPCLMLWDSVPLKYIKIFPIGFDEEGLLVYEDLREGKDFEICRGYPDINLFNEISVYMPFTKDKAGVLGL